MPAEILDRALEYASAGIAVFPVHYPLADKTCSCGNKTCRHVGKHPAIAHGFKSATTDTRRIRELWGSSPFNIGAPTGHRFDVLDEDPAHGGRTSLENLQEKFTPLPATLTSLTGGGGRHFFYDHIDGVKCNNDGKIGQGLDFKTTGGYVVMPPSLHASGNYYRWQEDEDQIAPAPEWLIDILYQEFPAGRSHQRRPPDYWAALATGPAAGDRHNAIISVAGLLLSNPTLDLHLAARLVHGYNLECCDPPKPRSEVNAIITYVLRRKK